MNIHITPEQIKSLQPYMPTLDDILAKDNLEEFETELGGAIVDYGMDSNDEINETGLKLERLYDIIYKQNN